MTTPVKGLDLSFSATSAEWWKDRFAEGYRAMSQALWTGGFQNNAGLTAVAERNLRLAREVGFRTSGYLNAAPPDWWPDAVAITNAKLNAGAEWAQTAVMIVDWEIADAPYWRVESLANALLAEGKQTDILYSRRSIIGATDTRTFKGLWLAQFDRNPDLDSTLLPAGPYGKIAGKQWWNSYDVGGVTIDADTFDLDFWPNGPEEDDMYGEDDRKRDNELAEAIKRLARRQLLVKYPNFDYVYEVVDGIAVHGSNPVVAAAQWGEDWSSRLVILDKNNPDHAEIMRMEHRYPDGCPVELGGLP